MLLLRTARTRLMRIPKHLRIVISGIATLSLLILLGTFLSSTRVGVVSNKLFTAAHWEWVPHSTTIPLGNNMSTTMTTYSRDWLEDSWEIDIQNCPLPLFKQFCQTGEYSVTHETFNSYEQGEYIMFSNDLSFWTWAVVVLCALSSIGCWFLGGFLFNTVITDRDWFTTVFIGGIGIVAIILAGGLEIFAIRVLF